MSKILDKLSFFFKKPKAVVLIGGNKESFERTISLVLQGKHQNEILVFNVNDKEEADLIRKIPSETYLVLNINEDSTKEIIEKTKSQILTFGISGIKADFIASDIKLNGGINFKVNYKGNIVPFWLEKASGEEDVYPVLAAVAAGTVFGLNLVEISENLKKT